MGLLVRADLTDSALNSLAFYLIIGFNSFEIYLIMICELLPFS